VPRGFHFGFCLENDLSIVGHAHFPNHCTFLVLAFSFGSARKKRCSTLRMAVQIRATPTNAWERSSMIPTGGGHRSPQLGGWEERNREKLSTRPAWNTRRDSDSGAPQSGRTRYYLKFDAAEHRCGCLSAPTVVARAHRGGSRASL